MCDVLGDDYTVQVGCEWRWWLGWRRHHVPCQSAQGLGAEGQDHREADQGGAQVRGAVFESELESEYESESRWVMGPFFQNLFMAICSSGLVCMFRFYASRIHA